MATPRILSKSYINIISFYPKIFAYSLTLAIFLFVFRYIDTHSQITLLYPSSSLGSINNAVDVREVKNQERRGKNVTSQKAEEAVICRDQESSCDIFDGRWVMDSNSSASYQPGSCPFIDNGFNCYKNGRPDLNYTKWRWQPKACDSDMQRLEGKKMLEMLRGKKMVFIGDSLNRNMWESLICILRDSLENKSKLLHISGKSEFGTKNSYAFKFTDYNCSIEYFRSSFLVQESKYLARNRTAKDTLRLDLIESSYHHFKDADIVIFNTGHWWTHEKTSQGKDYYQEGKVVHRQLSAEEALRRAMRTWARWVEAHIDTNRTLVFFRGYSSSHFGGGKWNKGGNCYGETEPVKEESELIRAPKIVEAVESVIKEMRNPPIYLNVTRMTDYRKDAHPSKYRVDREVQDCSHWCLPGVPDVWNQMLYSMLLRFQTSSLPVCNM